PSPPCSYATTRRSCAPSRRRSCWATLAAVSLLTELDAFYTDHRLCGELGASIEGPTVWFDCECGARIARRADDGDVLDLDGRNAHHPGMDRRRFLLTSLAGGRGAR